MSKHDDTPLGLYIAAYSDPDAARFDFAAFKALHHEKLVGFEALVLVSRDDDGKIHVKDNVPNVGVGTALGAAAGLFIGLIFPPSLLASGVVGGAVGAAAGGLISHVEKKAIKDEVADTLPPGSSGIVALFEPRGLGTWEETVSDSADVTSHDIDPESAADAKKAAESA